MLIAAALWRCLFLACVQVAALDDPLSIIRGKAFVAGTVRPAPQLTLVFFDRDAPVLTALTDSAGRFRCAVPAGLALRAGADGQKGPPCRAQAEDQSRWTWRATGSPFARGPDELRRMAAEVLRRPAKTIWRDRGGLPSLEVECAAAGEVEVLVRGTDGTPMADRRVQVLPEWAPPEVHGQVTVQFDGRTDGSGRFRMRWFEGMRRLRVVVPEEGFGSTGLFEVRAGRVARQETSPLARLGSVEGRVNSKVVGPGTAVVLEGISQNFGEAPCDAQGRFDLRNVLPGSYLLRVMRNGRRLSAEPIPVRVVPGQRIEGVVLGPAAPPRAEPPAGVQPGLRLEPQPAPGNATAETVWAEGAVRDQQGRAVAGASVFVIAGFDGGIRFYEQLRTAVADAGGHYQVRGPRQRLLGVSAVIAHAEGRPPVMAYPPASSRPLDATGRAVNGPITLDLTLADGARGGRARARVLKDGRPLAGASVELALDDVGALLGRSGQGPFQEPGGAALDALIHPTTVTGPDGVAHFAGLFPGTYKLTAADRGSARFIPWYQTRQPGMAFATAQGVGVAAGRETTAFALPVHPQPSTVRLQVVRPDGTPPADPKVCLGIGRPSPLAYQFLELDEEGIATFDFESPALWSVDIRFRDTELTSMPVSTEPYYQAEAVLPVSPGAALDEPVRLVSQRREPGSLRVRLRHTDGRTARGTVVIGDGIILQPSLAATSDDLGVVLFKDLPSGVHLLRGFIEGQAAPALKPAAEDAALGGHVAFPHTKATVAPGRQTNIELRARPVGYVRGTLRPPAGRNASDYRVNPESDRRIIDSLWQLDPISGQFLGGPFFPGTVRLQLRLVFNDGTSREAGTQSVEVKPGAVADLDLRPEEPAPPGQGASGRPATPDLGELERYWGAVVGLVMHADGKTPAFAARAQLFLPEWPDPMALATSDAAGRLHWHRRTGFIRSLGAGDEPAERPTLVVGLPGQTGAVILPAEPDRPVRATLPPPRTARGRVTLGGRRLDGQNARICIAAAYRGQGVVGRVLGVEVTAQADGGFELAGLTSGRYEVQAARDRIWLSRTIELTVDERNDPPSVFLDIPEPGGPLTVQIVDREGQPVADEPVTVVRPEGPLASLWPSSLRTQAGGLLTIRGLEAGRHTLLIGEQKEHRDVVVPPARGARTQATIERIVVRRADR